MKEFLDYISSIANKSIIVICSYASPGAGFMGDTVYDLFVRTYLIHISDVPVHQLHLKSTAFVNAGSQSETLGRIEDMLTEEEKNIVRRGRNAKPGTIPKNADVAEYRRATGFESLLGYLFLTGQAERLCQIMGDVLAKP